MGSHPQQGSRAAGAGTRLGVVGRKEARKAEVEVWEAAGEEVRAAVRAAAMEEVKAVVGKVEVKVVAEMAEVSEAGLAVVRAAEVSVEATAATAAVVGPVSARVGAGLDTCRTHTAVQCVCKCLCSTWNSHTQSSSSSPPQTGAGSTIPGDIDRPASPHPAVTCATQPAA